MDENRVREWILECTTKRFLSEGFGGFTMDVIARDSGVSKKTLYRLIPSKKKLVFMVLEGQAAAIEEKQSGILADSSMEFPARLEALFRVVYEFYSRISEKSLRDITKISPEVWEMVRRRRSATLDGILKLLEEGQRDGFIRSDITPGFLGRYFHSTIDSLLSPQTMMELDMTPRKLLDTTLSILYTGIQRQPGGIG